MSRNLLRCNTINYRQGYFEVLGNIHPGCVNLEAWEVHAERDISGVDLGDDSLEDDDVIANTEIELTIEEAEVLVSQLLDAIKVAKENVGA